MWLKGCELWDGGGAVKMEGCVALGVFLKEVLEGDTNNEQGVVNTPRREVTKKDKRIKSTCLSVNVFNIILENENMIRTFSYMSHQKWIIQKCIS